MQRIKLPQIQGHYLTLTLKDSSTLTLEIEEESTGRTFSLELEEGSIGQVTDGLYETSEDLFEGLQNGANNRCPGITLRISKGKLIYTMVISTESAPSYSFTLNLTEKRMDQVEVLERQLKLFQESKERSEAENKEKFERLEQNMKVFQAFQTKSEQRFDKLDNTILQMAKKLDRLEKLCDNLKESVVLKPKVYFNHNSANASGFLISDLNKTASRIGFVGGETYSCLELLPQIPSNGTLAYSFKINKLMKSLTFGITTETGKGYWKPNCIYGYSTANGKIFGIVEKDPDAKSPFGGTGKILKMVGDMDQSILSFFLEERLMNSCNILKSDKYFAYIGFEVIGESVTLI